LVHQRFEPVERNPTDDVDNRVTLVVNSPEPSDFFEVLFRACVLQLRFGVGERTGHYTELITSRLGLLAVVGVLVTAVSMGVLLVTLGPKRPAEITLATLLAAMTYGIVGALVGIVLGRLPGVYLMLFGPSLDVFLFQNPATTPDLPVELLPGHYPSALAAEAQFGGGITVETLGLSVAYLAVVTLASVALMRLQR
jgi:hypothetical protein